MQWVKITNFSVLQGSSLPLIPDLLSSAFHYHSPTLLSLYLFLPFPWRGEWYKSSLIEEKQLKKTRQQQLIRVNQCCLQHLLHV